MERVPGGGKDATDGGGTVEEHAADPDALCSSVLRILEELPGTGSAE